MRYCLRCRRLSGAGPICTSCGGSFGGRLCDYPRSPHLNPPGARFCSRCGSTVLREPAGSVPLAWIGGLLKADVFLGLAWLLLPPLAHWAGGLLGFNRYRDWRVWAFETFVPWLLPLFFLYYLTGLLPGRGGRQLRELLTRAVGLTFDVLGSGVSIATRLILKLLDRNGRGPRGTGV